MATEPKSISVIKDAAINLGAPLATACQLTLERQEKTPHNIKHVARAAHLAKPKPRLSRTPHPAESPPKTAPEIKAVAAVFGFEANPAIPQRNKNVP